MFKYFIAFILIILMPVSALAEPFTEGTDYTVIASNSTTQNPKAVPVTEFFSYGCPWCYRLEAPLMKWVEQQGNKISYHKVPVIFNKNWEYYAKAYYTAEALGMGNQLTPVLFKAILKDKLPLSSNQAMVDFFTSQGMDAEIIRSAFYHSPNIDMEISNSKKMMGLYQINAVPAVLVNNQYKTDLQLAKTEERFFAILDFLVDKAKQNKPSA
ncbi:thiol:disulfide interchange protein DsbA/DsbL [Legionella septentrionalis]|uniref:thiol:disulfide interchange protein DsbA/DsbL n=1 Tax=Legionella septentrionalis TaxID=2498109 RepID=UPI000F8EBC5F|nr:thiol:disulfide interchange protein DsbA/DsbL [Legionella septentrionalis]RUR02800.1 thiol:disulfide interchange protein DsbA/DsbL [Legionella septentrionalis]RUR11398.1 thiol:disulfide interchange protein DsbA/DsbL [Legionella septentrionalis]RUR15127.1 thiol:disulfide interchange protein DsbA/DsbL [Legionella septentrionalis]